MKKETSDPYPTEETQLLDPIPREYLTQLPAISSDNNSSAAIGAPEQPKFPVAALLYDQYNNPVTDSPLGIGSQNFEPALAN